MTGKIKSIGMESGLIQLENGTDAPFELSDVLTYDRASLAVDQFVSFDIGRGVHARAVNIVVQKQTAVPRSAQKSAGPRSYRYVGFEQLGSQRFYKFEETIPGEQKKVFIVAIDTALFNKHRVGMQEGPALCLRLLSEQPEAGALGTRSISDEDMLFHVAHRPVLKNASRSKKFSYTPGVGVQTD